MRAVMLEVSSELLARRRELGLDRRDEVWEEELHMVPPPAWGHQSLNQELAVFFGVHWEALGLGRTAAEVGVKRPGARPAPELGVDVPSDFRVPDRVFLLPERYDRIQGGWIVGGPDVVLEIVSPGDESRQKLGFYLSVGVREAIFVSRDTLEVEILSATAAGWAEVRPDAAGWARSAVLRTELRREVEARGPVLHLRRSDEPARTTAIRP